jgi:hypothetical protein
VQTKNIYNSAFKNSFASDSTLSKHTPINSPISGYDSEYTMEMNNTGNITQKEEEDTITNNSDNSDIIH